MSHDFGMLNHIVCIVLYCEFALVYNTVLSFIIFVWMSGFMSQSSLLYSVLQPALPPPTLNNFFSTATRITMVILADACTTTTITTSITTSILIIGIKKHVKQCKCWHFVTDKGITHTWNRLNWAIPYSTPIWYSFWLARSSRVLNGREDPGTAKAAIRFPV